MVEENIKDDKEIENLSQILADHSRSFYGLSEDDQVTLLNHSENMTYLIEHMILCQMDDFFCWTTLKLADVDLIDT